MYSLVFNKRLSSEPRGKPLSKQHKLLVFVLECEATTVAAREGHLIYNWDKRSGTQVTGAAPPTSWTHVLFILICNTGPSTGSISHLCHFMSSSLFYVLCWAADCQDSSKHTYPQCLSLSKNNLNDCWVQGCVFGVYQFKLYKMILPLLL